MVILVAVLQGSFRLSDGAIGPIRNRHQGFLVDANIAKDRGQAPESPDLSIRNLH